MDGGSDCANGPDDLGLPAAPCESCKNDNGLKLREGNCQSSATVPSAAQDDFMSMSFVPSP